MSPDQQLVALAPQDIAPAQQQLQDWCKTKIVSLGQELKEQRENLRIAKQAKWRHSGWLAQISRTKARMIYYAKLASAVKAGYLVIPSFDMDVVAVRVDRHSPILVYGDNRRLVAEAKPDLRLPPGTGKYVNGHLATHDMSFRDGVDSQGRPKTVERYRADAYQEIDFPVKMVNPTILAATERAMALKLFDRIGIVRGRARVDPIVVGQILDPKTGNSWYSRVKCVTFFIAWWLDPYSL